MLSLVKAMVTAVTNKQAAKILLGWTNFLPKLITKYHDGYIAQNLDAPTISMHKLFYPKGKIYFIPNTNSNSFERMA
jgi:hypothetical protein